MGYGMDELDDGHDAYDALDAFDEERREQEAAKKRSNKLISQQIKNEVSRQLSIRTTIGTGRVADDPRGKTVERTCRCKSKFMARQADINRGWAKSCSKSCAAKYK